MSRHGRSRNVVIIGGGHAGGRLAQLLAPKDSGCRVVLVSAENCPPYQRPPLSKQILLGTDTFENVCLLWPDGDPAWERVDLKLGVAATFIDRKKKSVLLSDGSQVRYDTLVLATGSSVRQSNIPGSDLPRVHYLRTIDQANAIARDFRTCKNLLVVGGGFVGLETAASARASGIATTVVEASDRVLARLVPARIGRRVAERHRAEGVTIRTGSMVARFIAGSSGNLKGAVLSTGETLTCDLAVVGVGVTARNELASTAGLDVRVGVLVDASLRSSDPDIFVCGDTATFSHPFYNQNVRVESWQNAEDHAAIVAQNIHGEAAVYDKIPFFWSDQYDLTLQVVGLPALGPAEIERVENDGSIYVFSRDAQGRITGGTGLGLRSQTARNVMIMREMVRHRVAPSMTDLAGPKPTFKELLKALSQSRSQREARQGSVGELT